MIPVDLLKPVEASAATPGTILIASRDRSSRPPVLVVGGNLPLLLHLGGDANSAFKAFPVGQNLDLCLAIDSWKLVVDTADLVSPFKAMPSAGQAFLSDGVAGIIGRYNHSDLYLGLNGSVLQEPEWSKFVGFNRWKIVAKVNECCETVTIFNSEAQAEIPTS